MSKILDEKQILLQLQQGDQNAFDELFRQYYRYLVIVAFRYVADDHLAKDIVQEVFLDVWKRRETLQIQQSVKAYLRRAVINHCLTQLKKKQRTSLGEASETNQADEQSNVDHLYEYKELEEVIETAVQSLPERCQQVFRMSREENLSHKAIAEQLNISTKTIENQVTKALKVIREALKKYGLLGVFMFFYLFG